MRRFSFDIICKFSFEMDPECFIHYFLESKLAENFDLTSKLLVQRAMLRIATHMETTTITEHWFEEEVEESAQGGGQCSHGDDRAEEEGDGDDDHRS
ncbi:hypothetical protein Ahy_A07g033339 [Arachis hypogaea]|uniref:Uncharacterized protein n=1 Tax=Arachis hypogaea TaxID=3818 RepID=A0A445C8Z8_ARAHY|nr:hypothetical protein Ahy_A07g033339 [Arachis hypogaea]